MIIYEVGYYDNYGRYYNWEFYSNKESAEQCKEYLIKKFNKVDVVIIEETVLDSFTRKD